MSFLAALGHLANIGQVLEIGQGHAHQREQIRWSKRNFALDVQALKIDLLGTAREDVRGTYDTYVERLDSLLLLNALLLPFALNTLQFSDQFVPGLNCYDSGHPEDCIEVRHPWLKTVWVYAVSLDLFIPFWSILMLLRCKQRLDGWLQSTLDDLHSMRKQVIAPSTRSAGVASARSSPRSSPHLPQLPAPSRKEAPHRPEDDLAQEQHQIVLSLGRWMVDYQDHFSALWDADCAPLVTWATRLLCCSAVVAIVLTAYMFWIFLANLPDNGHESRGHITSHGDHIHFAVLSILGLVVPGVWLAWGSSSSLGRRRGARGWPFAGGGLSAASSGTTVPSFAMAMQRPSPEEEEISEAASISTPSLLHLASRRSIGGPDDSGVARTQSSASNIAPTPTASASLSMIAPRYREDLPAPRAPSRTLSRGLSLLVEGTPRD